MAKINSAMNPAFNNAMHDQFISARLGETDYCDWLTFIGSPNLYDGGLFVNRTAEEQAVHDDKKYRYVLKVPYANGN